MDNTSLNLSYVLRRTRASGNVVLMHEHTGSELICYLSGSGTTTLGGVQHSYSPGTVCFIPQGLPHGEKAESESEILFCVFTGGECFGELPPLCMTDNSPDGAEAGQGQESICALLERIYLAMQKEEFFCRQEAEAYLSLILIRLCRYVGAPVPSPGGEAAMRDIFHYISDYYHTAIDLTQLAVQAGYSYDHFRHKFKQIYGLTPKQLLLFTRIDRAKFMLSGGTEKISAIAHACGFRSVSQFNRIFTERLSCTPGEYREQNRT